MVYGREKEENRATEESFALYCALDMDYGGFLIAVAKMRR
jgi:hypothetical protein